MRAFPSAAAVLSLLPALAGAVQGQGRPEGSFALKGALVHTAAGAPIPNAVIVVEKGRIAAVGRDVVIPAGLEVLDLTGKVVIPGMIDAYSRIGTPFAGDGAEPSASSGPENRAIDGLRLDVPDWTESVRSGITTVIVGPGAGPRFGGQSATLKTFGLDLRTRVLKGSGEPVLSANAANPSHFPALRAQLLKARDHRERAKAGGGGDKGRAPDRNLGLEALSGALDGGEAVRAHVQWAHDILALLELKDEFGLDLLLVDAPEAWKVAGELARRGVGVLCTPMVLGINLTEDALDGLAVLRAAGVRLAMRSDHPASPQKWFRLNGAMAVRHGLSGEEALAAMTIDPARMARIDQRVGSLEPGKDADLVVLNGTWYEPAARIEMVFVDGVRAFDRERDELPAAEAD